MDFQIHISPQTPLLRTLPHYLAHAILCLGLVIIFCGTAFAQAGSLTTTFASNNGQSGNMFDVITFGQKVRVESIAVNITGTRTIEVYTRTGTWVGNTGAAGWTLVSTNTVTSAGNNVPTPVDVTDFVLPANSTTGFYVTTTNGGMRYSNGTGVGNVAANDGVIRINEGSGRSYAFGSIFQPRVWNGTINYLAIIEDLSVSKAVNTATLSAAPATLGYTITVNNDGNVPLTGLSLTDTLTQNGINTPISLTGPSGDTNGNNELDVSETWTYTGAFTATQANLDDASDLVNEVTVSSNEVIDQTASATTTVAPAPSLQIVKTADQTSNVPAGTIVTYTYAITNNRNITIDGIALNDNHIAAGADPVPLGETLTNDAPPLGDSFDTTANNGTWTTLAPGDTIELNGTYVIQQADIDLLQ